jgi:hypothetical protein
MGAVVSATLAVQPIYYTHRMFFEFEANRIYNIQNNTTTITVLDDANSIVLYEWIPYLCRPNPYVVKNTRTSIIVLEFECDSELEYDIEFE